MQGAEIGRIAIDEDRIIVTKDVDFPDSFFLKGPPPRIIYSRLGNIRNRELTVFLKTRWDVIQELIVNEAGMIVLNREQLISY